MSLLYETTYLAKSLIYDMDLSNNNSIFTYMYLQNNVQSKTLKLSRNLKMQLKDSKI